MLISATQVSSFLRLLLPNVVQVEAWAQQAVCGAPPAKKMIFRAQQDLRSPPQDSAAAAVPLRGSLYHPSFLPWPVTISVPAGELE